MGSFITILEEILTYVVQFSVTVLEFFGVFILVYTAVRCFISWTRKDHFVRLDLAQGIALALEFKLGGEVLRTVITRDRDELFMGNQERGESAGKELCRPAAEKQSGSRPFRKEAAQKSVFRSDREESQKGINQQSILCTS